MPRPPLSVQVPSSGMAQTWALARLLHQTGYTMRPAHLVRLRAASRQGPWPGARRAAGAATPTLLTSSAQSLCTRPALRAYLLHCFRCLRTTSRHPPSPTRPAGKRPCAGLQMEQRAPTHFGTWNNAAHSRHQQTRRTSCGAAGPAAAPSNTHDSTNPAQPARPQIKPGAKHSSKLLPRTAVHVGKPRSSVLQTRPAPRVTLRPRRQPSTDTMGQLSTKHAAWARPGHPARGRPRATPTHATYAGPGLAARPSARPRAPP